MLKRHEHLNLTNEYLETAKICDALCLDLDFVKAKIHLITKSEDDVDELDFRIWAIQQCILSIKQSMYEKTREESI